MLKKIDRKDYIDSRLEHLEWAIGERYTRCKDYTIEVDDWADRELRRIHKEFETDPDRGMDEKTYIDILGLQKRPPAFKIYFKGKPVGRLFLTFFTLYSCEPEALYVMESIGKWIFECKKEELQVDENQWSNFKDWAEKNRNLLIHGTNDNA